MALQGRREEGSLKVGIREDASSDTHVESKQETSTGCDDGDQDDTECCPAFVVDSTIGGGSIDDCSAAHFALVLRWMLHIIEYESRGYGEVVLSSENLLDCASGRVEV